MSQWIRRCTTAAATVLAFSAVRCRRNSDPRGCQRRRLRQRRAAHLGRRVRQHRRRSRPLRSAAGLLRANAIRPAAAAERQRVCQLQRPVGQRQRVQLVSARQQQHRDA